MTLPAHTLIHRPAIIDITGPEATTTTLCLARTTIGPTIDRI